MPETSSNFRLLAAGAVFVAAAAAGFALWQSEPDMRLTLKDKTDMENPQRKAVWLGEQLERMDKLALGFGKLAAEGKTLSPQTCNDGSIYSGVIGLSVLDVSVSKAGNAIARVIDPATPEMPGTSALPTAPVALMKIGHFSAALGSVCPSFRAPTP